MEVTINGLRRLNVNREDGQYMDLLRKIIQQDSIYVLKVGDKQICYSMSVPLNVGDGADDDGDAATIVVVYDGETYKSRHRCHSREISTRRKHMPVNMAVK